MIGRPATEKEKRKAGLGKGVNDFKSGKRVKVKEAQRYAFSHGGSRRAARAIRSNFKNGGVRRTAAKKP